MEKIQNIYWDLKRKITNFFFYGWKLRNLYSWEASCVYEMIEVHLSRCYDVFENHGHLMWQDNKKNMRKLKTTIELAKKLKNEDYHNHYYKLTQGYRREFVECEDGYFTLSKYPEHIEKRLKYAFKRDQSQNKQDMDLFYKLLYKHLEGWWD